MHCNEPVQIKISDRRGLSYLGQHMKQFFGLCGLQSGGIEGNELSFTSVQAAQGAYLKLLFLSFQLNPSGTKVLQGISFWGTFEYNPWATYIEPGAIAFYVDVIPPEVGERTKPSLQRRRIIDTLLSAISSSSVRYRKLFFTCNHVPGKEHGYYSYCVLMTFKSQKHRRRGDKYLSRSDNKRFKFVKLEPYAGKHARWNSLGIRIQQIQIPRTQTRTVNVVDIMRDIKRFQYEKQTTRDLISTFMSG